MLSPKKPKCLRGQWFTIKVKFPSALDHCEYLAYCLLFLGKAVSIPFQHPLFGISDFQRCFISDFLWAGICQELRSISKQGGVYLLTCQERSATLGFLLAEQVSHWGGEEKERQRGNMQTSLAFPISVGLFQQAGSLGLD